VKIGLDQFISEADRGEIEPLTWQEIGPEGQARVHGLYVSRESFVLEFERTAENVRRAQQAAIRNGIDLHEPEGER
jgi:hypothetical protein